MTGGVILLLKERDKRMKRFWKLFTVTCLVLLCSGVLFACNDTSKEEVTEPVVVSLEIDSSRAAEFGYDDSIFSGDVTINKGGTVYDALVAADLSLGGNEAYVSSINGLSEKVSPDYPMSGWIYMVDGEKATVSCGDYILEGGEEIVWSYSLDGGKDVTGTS